MANARAVIDIDINAGPAAAELRRLQSQINGFSAALNKANTEQGLAAKGISRQLSDLVNSSKFFTAETVRMQTSAAQLDNTLKKGQVTMGQFFSARFKKDGLAAAQVLSLANARASALETQFIQTGAAAGGMRDALAIRPLQAFNSAATISAQKLAIHRAMLQQATTSMINFGKNTQWAGRQLMVGFTVPLTIFGGLAAKTFRELEEQAINFKKVYGDIFTTDQETQAALENVQELSKEFTKYGIAVKDTMALAGVAAQSGLRNAELMAATTQATRLATLGQMEQAEAMQTIISLQTAFKTSNEELAESVDFLNIIENQTVLSLQDVAGAIPRVAPVIRGLGGDVKDLAVLLVAMKEGGVTAGEGANALKSSLGRLITPTKRAKEMAAEFGINLDQIVQSNRGQVVPMIQELADAMSKLGGLEQQQLLSTIFGKFQYARIGALFKSITDDSSQAARAMGLINMSAEELAKTAEKELLAVEEGVGTKMTAAMERLKVAIAPIGEMFLKMATPIINFLAGIAEKFNNLPDFAKKFIGLATVITGLVIPAGTMFLGLLMNLIGTLVKFGHLIGVAFKGFLSGGIKGSFDAVSQAVKYMSLAEIDASNAAQQLAGTTQAVNAALLDQVSRAEGSTAAIMGLAGAYDILAQNMRESMLVGGLPMAAPGQAGLRAGRSGLLYRPLPIVARNKGGSIPYLSDGGRPTVPGVGNKDTVPAMLTPGEFVINKKATQQNLGLLHAINDGDVQYRNKGGGIAEMGRKFYGPRPNPYAIAAQAARQRLEEFESSRSAIAGMFGLPISGPRATQRTIQTAASQASRARRSQDIYEMVASKDTKASRLLRKAVELGLSPERLGLKQIGNLVLEMSPSANMRMANGNLTRAGLTSELSNSSVYGPLDHQLRRYFGKSLNDASFDQIYRQQIGLLPEAGITNQLFEKATRNALRVYMDQNKFSRSQRNAFLRDVLAPDTIRANVRKQDIRNVLAKNNIDFNEDGDDIIAIIDGERFNFGDLGGRSIDYMGRSSSLSRYDKIPVAKGMARVHANKGGMIPGVQYLFRGGQALSRTFASISGRAPGFLPRALTGTSSGLKGSQRNRLLESSAALGRGSLTLEDIAGKSVQRGHVVQGIKIPGTNSEYLPGLMIFQSPSINQSLAAGNRGRVTGLDIARDLAGSKVHPFSIMLDAARRLGIPDSVSLPAIQRTYDSALRQFGSNIGNKVLGPNEFYQVFDPILRRNLPMSLYANLRSQGSAREIGGSAKSMGRFIMSESSLIQTRNKGGEIFESGRQTIVPGVGNTDTVPAALTPGEFVINKRATQQNKPLLQAINSGKNIPGIQYFARGGIAQRLTQALMGPKPITNVQQQQVIERQLTNWLDMKMRNTNVRELGKLLGTRQKETELFRGMKMRPSDSGFQNRFPKETQDALYRFARSGNPDDLAGIIGKPVAIAPRSFSTSRKVAQTFGGDPINVGNPQKDAAPLILKLRNQEGIFGFKPTERVGTAKQSGRFVKEKRFYSRGSQNEKEIVPVGDPRRGDRRDVVVGRWGFDGKDVFIDTGAKISRRETSRAIQELDTFTAARFTPRDEIRKTQLEVQRLQVAVERAKRNPGRTSSKELGDLATRLMAQVDRNKLLSAGTRKDRRALERMTTGTSSMLDQVSVMFNRAKAVGLNRGNVVPGMGNTDTVPAMLTPGEFVVNKKATMENLGLLHAINGGQVQFLNEGGVAGAMVGEGKTWFVDDGKGNLKEFNSEKDATKYAKKVKKSFARQQIKAGKQPGMMRGMGASMGLGMGGMGVMMLGQQMQASAAQRGEASAAGGMIANAGIALSMASILPFLKAGIAIPLAAIAAAVGAAVIALKAFREATDRNVRAAADFGANLGGAANRMEEVSAATGYQFARDRSPLESFKFTAQEAEAASQFTGYFESEPGQKFVEDLQKLDPKARYEEVRSAIAMAIADGMDKETAKAYGDAIAFYTNDSLLKLRIGRDIGSGEFGKGSAVAISEIEKRTEAAAKSLGAVTQAGEMSRSYLSDMLGTGGMTNIVGEAALSTIPFLRGIHETINDIVDDGFQVGDVLRNLNPVAMFGTTISTFANLKGEFDLLGQNAESVAAQMGSSIQILKEVENAEALLGEERKKGIISAEQYNSRLEQLRAIEEEQYSRMNVAIKSASDAGFTSQAISDQLILSGMTGDLAKTIANATSKNAVAQKMFNENFEKLSEEQQNVVTSVISRTLTGITPENAQSKIAEIENTYSLLSEQLVNAAKNGLTSIELDEIVLSQQVKNFVESAFTEVDMPRAEAATRRRLATENLVQADTLGLRREDVTGALGSFIDRDFALRIASSKQQLSEFIPLVKELQQFPGINLEIITKTEDGRDPEKVAKDIKKTLDGMSKLKFKGVRQEIVDALPQAETFIGMARQAGIEFENIPESFKEIATQADALSEAFDPKRTGALKKINVQVAMDILGADVEDPQALMSALQSAFPEGLDPLFLPILLQVANPEVLNALQGQYGNMVASAIAEGQQSVDLPINAGTSFARYQTVDLSSTTGISQFDAQGFTGAKTKDTSGGGGGQEQKSLLEQLREQFKSLKDIFKSMKRFIDSEDGSFKKIAAGPFGPEFIEFLKSQGEEGLKILNGRLDKMREAYRVFRDIQRQEATNFAQTLPANLIRQRQNIVREGRFRNRLESAGFNEEQSDMFIEGIGGPETIREYDRLNKKKKDGKKLTQEERDFIRQINRAIKQGGPAAEKLFATIGKQDATNNLKDMNDELGLLTKVMSMGYTKEEADQILQLGVNSAMSADDIRKLGDAVKQYNLQLLASDPEALAQSMRDNAMEINDLRRQIAELETIEPRMKELEAQQKIEESISRNIELKQRESSAIERSIELKRREIEPIDDAIQKYEEQISQIEESYDIQLQALDDVAQKEENLARIREGRLDIAGALSRGDVAGAAQAAIEMRRRFSEQQQEATRNALETRRQQEIDAIQGNIKQKQEERKKIEEEIRDLELQQRNIQDEIYSLQQSMIPVQDEIYRLNGLIADEADRLDEQYNNAANELLNLQAQLREAIRLQNELNAASGGGGGAASAPSGGGLPPASSYEQGSYQDATQSAAVASSFDQSVLSNAARLNQAAAAGQDVTKLGFTKSDWADLAKLEAANKAAGLMYGGKVKKMMFGGSVNYRGSRETAPGMMYGGRVKKMAFGNIVPGSGMTDKVPAMLTPGEFVVRKSVAQQMLPTLKAMNSQVFPGMNSYKFKTPSSGLGGAAALVMGQTTLQASNSTMLGPNNVQYNYNLTVSAETNANPEEIANAVIYQIKRFDDRRVKGTQIG